MTGETEYLLARLDEQEAAAREAVAIGKIHSRHDDAQVTTVLSWRWSLLAESVVDGRTGGYGTSHHPGAPTPEEVLADIAAKRELVELASEATGLDMQVDGEFRVANRDLAVEPYVGDLMIRTMLQTYAGRDDFDPSWTLTK